MKRKKVFVDLEKRGGGGGRKFPVMTKGVEAKIIETTYLERIS
jgi:hypothetical protein